MPSPNNDPVMTPSPELAAESERPCEACGCLFPLTNHDALMGNLLAVVRQRDRLKAALREMGVLSVTIEEIAHNEGSLAGSEGLSQGSPPPGQGNTMAERRRVGGVLTDRQEAEEIIGRMFNRIVWPDTTRLASLAVDALENAGWTLTPPADNDGDHRG